MTESSTTTGPAQLSIEVDSSSEDSNSTANSDVEDVEDVGSKGWLQSVETPNGAVLPSVDPAVFGEVNIQNSSHLHLGNRTFYNGPVTIKQFYSHNGSNGNGVEGGDPEKIEAAEVDKSADEQNQNNPNRKLFLLFDPEKWLRSKRHLMSFGMALVVMMATALAAWLLFKGSGTDDPTYPAVPPPSPNDSSINNDPTITGLLMTPRVQWGAQPPNEPPTRLEVIPAVYVIISHTASMPCYTQAQCVLSVRVAQTFHIESKGWNDIAYNFLVGGDGLVYEGRGWDIEGAHTFNYNKRSIGISFIGTFNKVKPTNAQLSAAKKLISWGVENGKISENYKLLGHRQCIKTESPGETLYGIIRTWDHWSATP